MQHWEKMEINHVFTCILNSRSFSSLNKDAILAGLDIHLSSHPSICPSVQPASRPASPPAIHLPPLYNLNMSPAHRRADIQDKQPLTHTFTPKINFESPTHLDPKCLWTVGRGWSSWRESRQTIKMAPRWILIAVWRQC